MRHKAVTVLVAFALAFSFLVNIENARAGETHHPGAYYANANVEADPAPAKILDGGVVSIASLSFDQQIVTAYFAQPTPGIDLPPVNATITSVFFTAVVSTRYYRNYSLSYGFDGIYGTNWFHEHWFEITPMGFPYYFINTYWNITSYETWGREVLMSPYMAVRLFSDDRGTTPLMIDYIGIQYNWTLPEEEEANETGVISPLSITGVFGVVGVLGMIAVVPASIWLYRRDGGSKIIAGIVALGTFMFCATLFIASLGA